MAVPRLRGTRKKGPSDRSSAGEPHRSLPLAAEDGYNDRGCSGDDEARVRMRKKGLNPSSTLAASPPLSPLTASTFGTIVWRPPSPRSGQPSATAVFASPTPSSPSLPSVQLPRYISCHPRKRRCHPAPQPLRPSPSPCSPSLSVDVVVTIYR